MKKYRINHTLKMEIILPTLAIEDCYSFTDEKKGQGIISSDGKEAVVDYWEYIHMCSDNAEKLIRELYGCDVWSFIKRWHSCQDVCSLRFIHLILK